MIGELSVLGAPIARPCVALLGVLQRLLVRPVGKGQALYADIQTGVIHHGEHRLHPGVGFTYQVSDRLVEIHNTRRAAVDAQLVLDRHTSDFVTCPKRPIGIYEELRHHEQTDALGAGRSLGNPCQYQVDYVCRRDRVPPM